MLEKQQCPIEKLRFYSDEKLSYCERYSIHSVFCPRIPKASIEFLKKSICESCIKNSENPKINEGPVFTR